MPHLRRATPALALALTLACGSDGEAPTPPAQAPGDAPPAEAEVSRARLVRDADRRVPSETIDRGLAHPDPEIRRTAVLALARLHSLEAVPRLRRSLRDTDPRVRRAASLGLAALEERAPRAAVEALAGALAAERDPETRSALIRDLGRLRTDRALAAVVPALDAERPEERAAACYGVAERGLADRSVPPEVRSRLAALLGPSEPAEVRLACAYALSRLPVATDPERARGVVVALGVAAGDEDPEVRAYAHRALGRHAGADLETLVHGTRDDDWRVAVHAFRALGRQAAGREGGAARLAAALREAHARAVAEGDVAAGPKLHVLLAGLAAAAPLARATPVYDLASSLHGALGAVPEGTPPTRDRGLAHCAAAELTDRGRGWPSRVEDCGLEQVLPWERRVLEARILGDLDGAVDQRLARLRRLLEAERPAVREAAVAAAAKIPHADATALVLEALHADDPGVRAASADALRAIARRRPEAGMVPPPLPVDDAVAALRAMREATPDDALETLVTWIGAVDAVDARSFEEPLRELARHPSQAVRLAARDLLARWGVALPDDPVPAPPNPIALADVPEPDARPRVRLETDRGPIVIALRPDAAPTTVARFLGLVADGFYDGLTFHRVVPAFVVQGGDPRGDGYGGPGWWQRCEDNRLPYRRGTVGMALAGRDTGGSQLFVTYGAQPHLEGRYTAFGRVVEGLEHLEALQAGDRIRRAIVSE
jgi:cyclophilin family peptidyl-prolyl cis-trans isomerase/HEAT repeat protein